MDSIIHDMQAEQEVCGLGCAGRIKNGENCKRYIVGSQSGFYFIHRIMGYCDMRNAEWLCYQHTKGKKPDA